MEEGGGYFEMGETGGRHNEGDENENELETSFGGDDDFLERVRLREEWKRAKENEEKDEEEQDLTVGSMAELKAQLIINAQRDLMSKFPEVDLTQVKLQLDDKGRLIVTARMPNENYTKWYKLYKSGGRIVARSLPNAVLVALGKGTEELLIEKNEEAKRLKARREGLYKKVNQEGDPQARSESEREIEQVDEQVEENEEETEQILERLTLKDRVKWIFKKYGVTVVGVMAAVGTVIGVIVSNLRAGLTKVAKGVGYGLEDIAKKLGQILPGMVGAIVSFLFRAAGEAVGFLAKHAWLLILLVVTFVVEQYKK